MHRAFAKINALGLSLDGNSRFKSLACCVDVDFTGEPLIRPFLPSMKVRHDALREIIEFLAG